MNNEQKGASVQDVKNGLANEIKHVAEEKFTSTVEHIDFIILENLPLSFTCKSVFIVFFCTKVNVLKPRAILF